MTNDVYEDVKVKKITKLTQVRQPNPEPPQPPTKLTQVRNPTPNLTAAAHLTYPGATTETLTSPQPPT